MRLVFKWRACSDGRGYRPQRSSATRRPIRNHTAALKAKVVLAALKGDRTLAEKYDRNR
jgi:hypothetical protein